MIRPAESPAVRRDEPPHSPVASVPVSEIASDPVPDPFDDADALEALEHRITTLAAHLHAAEHRFLTLVAEFDRRRGWELGGHRSCAHWLAFRCGYDLRTARERVRVARTLERLPLVSTAMSRGELSFSKVRAMGRIAEVLDPETEAEILEVAKDFTAAELERFVRSWRLWSRGEEAAVEERRFRSRRFAVVPDQDGMYLVRGRLPAEVGALLLRAVEAASDVLFREEAREETTEGQRRADAVGLLAERALAAGFGGAESPDGSAEPGEGGSPEPRGSGSAEPGAPLSGTRAERYQVMLHVDEATLRERGTPGRSNLEDGTRLPAESYRRLTCDAAVVKVIRGAEGEILDVGRRSRTVPPALRRALEIRDGGCRWPGCGLRFTDAHHVTHWQDGGATEARNLILLCRFHHRKVHEECWRAAYNPTDDTALFFGPRGVVRAHRPELEDGSAEPGRSGPVRGNLRGGSGEPGPGLGMRPRPRTAQRSGMGVESSMGAGEDDGARDGNEKAKAPAPAPAPPPDPVGTLVEENLRRGVDPDGWTCASRYRRRADIPWNREARLLEALEEAMS